MCALRAPKVETTPSFDQDVAALQQKYPEIGSVVEELTEFLTIAWNPPHVAVDAAKLPGIYVTQLDYPPMGASGVSRFILVYHASPQSENPMQQPLRRYTLLSLVEP
jgi:hypothetical protein